MRVCEIAKEAGVTSAEVLRVAEKAGVEVSSAISTVDDGELAALKLALANAPKADVSAARAAKTKRAAELNAAFFAAQKAKLAEHLKIAKDAAEGKAVTVAAPATGATRGTEEAKPSSSPSAAVTPSLSQGAASPAAVTPSLSQGAASAAPTAPKIRMAPGVKPKILPTISAAKTGLTAAGFKPLQHARPAATISISVAAAPKPKPPKPTISVGVAGRDDRKGRKDREGA